MAVLLRGKGVFMAHLEQRIYTKISKNKKVKKISYLIEVLAQFSGMAVEIMP